jgi:molecular chaperone GrpE
MREDSAEFEEGIILQEFRKGFKIGDRLLRPSMVKVSAGPGPAKPEQASQEEQVTNEISEDSKENDRNTETESA